MKKLPQRTEELLKLMQANEKARVIYMPYRGRFNPNAYYWCMELTHRSRCTREAKCLLDRGLATKHITNKYDGGHDLVLTEAGKQFAAGDGSLSKEKP